MASTQLTACILRRSQARPGGVGSTTKVPPHEAPAGPRVRGPALPLSEWKRFYRETIQDPIHSLVYARRTFFDVWPLAGDRSILRQVHDHILAELDDHAPTVPLLANDTLARVALLTLYEGEVVLELDGEQRDSFDITTTTIWPIARSARVLALAGRRITCRAMRWRGWKRGRRLFPARCSQCSAMPPKEDASRFTIRRSPEDRRATPGTLGSFG